MSIDTSQLFAEEQWILNTIKSIKVQINALEIEKLHLENLVTQHTKIPAEVYLASIKDDAAEVEPGTSLEAMEFEPRLDPEQDDEFLAWPQLNLNVHAPGPSTNHMEEEEEEEEDEDEKDDNNTDFELHNLMLQ